MSKLRFLSVFLLLFTIVPTLAQTDEVEKIKEKQRREIAFVEEILKDARHLRLPENRAFIYAKAADALWQTNEKRARELFQNSIGELLAAQAEVEGEKRNQRFFQNLLYGQSPRWEILWLIANRDADLALDAQVRTRPARLPLSLESFSENQIYSNAFQFAKSEFQNEQRLFALAAEQNPQRAARLLRESINKNISYETLNLLRNIHQKDAPLAAKLAEEVAEKFLTIDYAKNYDAMNTLGNFLNEFGAERQPDDQRLLLSEKLVRDLASKMLDVWLNPDVTSQYGNANLPVFEKYFPERIAKVKQKFQRINNPTRPQEYSEYEKLMQSNPSGEELLNQAGKFSKNLRLQIYQQAAQKLAQNGNIQQAEKIIKEIYPDQTEFYVSQWQQGLAHKAIAEGKFDEANRLISQIDSEDAQINSLVYLASTIYQKDQKENKNWALSVLDQARGLLPDQPETANEINMLMNLAAQYAQVEPARAFTVVESLVSSMDELSQAQAVLAKYQMSGGNFRQGEFQIISGSYAYGAYNLPNILRTLKNTDAERVLQITNGFSRPDVRLSIQIQLVESNGQQIANLPINLNKRQIYRNWLINSN